MGIMTQGVTLNANAAVDPLVNVSLKANQSLSCMAFHGDRMYVGGYQTIDYKSHGEVTVYDRSGAVIDRFDIVHSDPAGKVGTEPYGIYVGDDGNIAVITQYDLLIYDAGGNPLHDYDVSDLLGTPVNGKTYTLPTGLAGDGQHYYFGSSYTEEVLKVTRDGKLAGSYPGVNVTRSIEFRDGKLYVLDSGLDKMIVLDGDMKKLAEYSAQGYLDRMGLYDDYIVAASGGRAYVYDMNMSLFNTVDLLPQGWQAWGISRSGGQVAIVANNNRDRTQAGLFLVDGTFLTTKPIAPAAAASPDPVPVVEAVAAGTAIGFLGLFLGKAQSILGGLYDSLLKRLPAAFKKFQDAIVGYVKGVIQSKIFNQESRLYKTEAREHVPLFLGFSSIELLVIAVGSVLLAASYVIAKKAALGPENIAIFLVAGVVAIVAHDIAHRYFARKYKVVTEYQFWWLGTIVMFVTAIFFGVVYAVPARTVINKAGEMDKRSQGIVYLAGPLVSFGFAVFFLLLSFLGGAWTTIGLLGVSMNLLSSVYGLLPFNPMDGKKVFDWRIAVWAAAFLPALAIYLLATIYLA